MYIVSGWMTFLARKLLPSLGARLSSCRPL